MSGKISAGVSVARGASYLLAEGLIKNSAGVVFLMYATRILPVTEIGVLSALKMILAFFMTVGTFAIPSAATKYISQSMGMQRVDMAKGIYKKAFRFGLIVSFLPIFLCLGASNIISAFVSGNADYQLLIVILGLDAFAWLLSPFLNGTLWGLQKFKETSFSGVVAACIGYSISAFLLALGFGLIGVVVGWVLGDFLGLGLLLFFTHTSFQSTTEDETYPFGNLFKYSMPLYVSGILSYFSGTIDKFVLLFIVGLATLGIYNVALAGTAIVGLVAGSISSSLFPQFSKLYGGHGKMALEKASCSASRYVFFIYMPMAMGFAAVSLPTITLFVGPAYASGWLPLTIVSLTMALTSASVIMGSLFMSLGITRIFLESNVLSMIIGTALSLVLVAPFGMVGVTLAKVAIGVVSFIYFLFRLRRVFGLHFDWDAFRKSLIASAGMAGGVAIVEYLWMNTYFLPMYILLGAGLYLAMLKILKAVNKEDMTLLKQFLPKRLGKTIDILARLLA